VPSIPSQEDKVITAARARHKIKIMLKIFFEFFTLFSFQFKKLSDSPRRIAGRKLKLKNYSFAPRETGIADSNAIDAILRVLAVSVPMVNVIVFVPSAKEIVAISIADAVLVYQPTVLTVPEFTTISFSLPEEFLDEIAVIALE
jgi:hypothetical protein